MASGSIQVDVDKEGGKPHDERGEAELARWLPPRRTEAQADPRHGDGDGDDATTRVLQRAGKTVRAASVTAELPANRPEVRSYPSLGSTPTAWAPLVGEPPDRVKGGVTGRGPERLQAGGQRSSPGAAEDRAGGSTSSRSCTPPRPSPSHGPATPHRWLRSSRRWSSMTTATVLEGRYWSARPRRRRRRHRPTHARSRHRGPTTPRSPWPRATGGRRESTTGASAAPL